MKEFYIEVYSPPYPNKGRKVRVWDEYPGQALSPNLVMFFSVKAENKEDALANLIAGEARTLIHPRA